MKSLIKNLIYWLFLFILRTRYKIQVKGLDKVRERGGDSILFLPNHPALIDPVIVSTVLAHGFMPRPLADEQQVDRIFVRPFVKLVRAVVIPDIKNRGSDGQKSVLAGLSGIVEGLRQGDNILLYPAGRIYRSRREDLQANSSVKLVLDQVPEARPVLVRTVGLWGSSFSRASGRPSLLYHWKRNLLAVLSGFIFFTPKRDVTIEFYEADDFPHGEDKLAINRYLETYYNKVEQYNTYVPYFWWQGREPKKVVEPEHGSRFHDAGRVPAAIRKQVEAKLKELTGLSSVSDNDLLAKDLALDSLVLVELAAWIESEFGVSLGNTDDIQTVGATILAAAGEISGSGEIELAPMEEHWFAVEPAAELELPQGETIAELFLYQALNHPGRLIVSDQNSGSKSYGNLLTGIFALRPTITRIQSERVGIMLPASTASAVTYLSVLFSGKTPVMLNWTVGIANMRYCLENVDVDHVITAKALVEKIKGQGIDVDQLSCRFLYLEEMAAGLTLPQKLIALFKSRFVTKELSSQSISPTAAILFTSGSEAKPKAVPLSHANLLANCRDLVEVFSMTSSDRLLGMLPPFHSLGLTGTLVLPLVVSMPTVYSPNPTEGNLLAKITQQSGVTILIGTPTFLGGIVGSAEGEFLPRVRLAVTGAEKCQDYVYEAIRQSCPKAVISEGYGITECAPVVSVNDPADPVPGTIGRLMKSMECRIVHPESYEPLDDGIAGMLLLRGPNVFNGYLNYHGKSPFIEYDKKKWYVSGDLVKSENGLLTFCGRLKRFIKLGGEMISLPAIEEILLGCYQSGDEPVLAVESTPGDDHPQVVLFSTLDLKREEVNQKIRESGLSPLHNIRQIQRVAEIPLLGTGKTDYRGLQSLIGQ